MIKREVDTDQTTVFRYSKNNIKNVKSKDPQDKLIKGLDYPMKMSTEKK